MAPNKEAAPRQVAQNRRARFDYFIEDKYEAGLALLGTEVKALRQGRANIAESYTSVEDGGLYLINATIPIYPPAGQFNHEPTRKRKLLLHRREISRLKASSQEKGLTLVVLSLWFSPRGHAKVTIAVCRGKKIHDKRETLKAKEARREIKRVV